MAEALVPVRSGKKWEKLKRQESHFFFEKTEILVVLPNSGKIAHREDLGIYFFFLVMRPAAATFLALFLGKCA